VGVLGVDTNVLVRYLARDDIRQTAIATDFFNTRLTADQPAFVSLIVLLETVWVLSSSYKYSKALIVEVVEKILNAAELVVEDSAGVGLALDLYCDTKVDFADALIAVHNSNNGCETTVTFDKVLAETGLAKLL